MKICPGKSILSGIAIGKIFLYQKKEFQVSRRRIGEVKEELSRFEAQRKRAMEQIEQLYRETCKRSGKAQASIFQAHKLLLEDTTYLESIRNMIRSEQVNAEYAVAVTGLLCSNTFAAMEDSVMRARSADVRDVSGRLVRLLSGIEETRIRLPDSSILLADDLSPSETVRIETEGLLALVLKNGAANSHAAILARSMGIPTLVRTDVTLLPSYDGMTAIADAVEGRLILDPDEETLCAMREKMRLFLQEQEGLRSWIGKENISPGGRRIDLYANIGSLKELDQALYNDAGGIGLFRSEFLYLGRDTYPTEEEQFLVYREALSRMEGKPVTIRTLDIGADKREPYLDLPEEENPALGCRAIRLCLKRREVFATQLRAILRAGAYGNCSVLLPMIVSAREVREVRSLMDEIMQDLNARRISFGHPRLGIMIETPAAALISETLAKEADFFSIGTNDLTQYTLAMDRQNPELEQSFDVSHPAVLKLIQITVENGHKAGIPVGICGELASDLSLTGRFLAMGVDMLSVIPSRVLSVRRAILTA